MNGLPVSQTSEDALNVNPITGTEKRKNEILHGYCQCGCGRLAPIATMTSTRKGHKKGLPIRFLYGHWSKTQPKGNKAYRWKCGIKGKSDGRIQVHNPTHNRADSAGYVLMSIIVVEKALGKEIPKKSAIHHFDEKVSNDSNCNLILCENHAYHMLLHQRKRAYDACGHASWRKCRICKKYDGVETLYRPPKGGSGYHRECRKKYRNKIKEL